LPNDAFRSLYHRADVVIAKGQGNYEGLSGTGDERLFHIFRVKCERVAELTGAPVGSLVMEQNLRTMPAGAGSRDDDNARTNQ
jgi:uncharacterized protein with ATP-grasp and redox domains